MYRSHLDGDVHEKRFGWKQSKAANRNRGCRDIAGEWLVGLSSGTRAIASLGQIQTIFSAFDPLPRPRKVDEGSWRARPMSPVSLLNTMLVKRSKISLSQIRTKIITLIRLINMSRPVLRVSARSGGLKHA